MAADAQGSIDAFGKDVIKKVFAQFDTNGDGRISASELAGVLLALGQDASPSEISDMFAVMDSDGDGFVDLQEFTDFLRHGGGGGDSDSRELWEAFNMYDADGDGLISALELHRVLIRLGVNCSVQDCERMILSVDVDGDGYVNFKEFKKMMTDGMGGRS